MVHFSSCSTEGSFFGNALYAAKVAAAAGCGSLITSGFIGEAWGPNAKTAAIASAILVACNASYQALANREKEGKLSLASVCVDGVVDSAILQSAGLISKSLIMNQSFGDLPASIGAMALLGKVNTETVVKVAAMAYPFLYAIKHNEPFLFFSAIFLALPLGIVAEVTVAPVLGKLAEKIQKRLTIEHFPPKSEIKISDNVVILETT